MVLNSSRTFLETGSRRHFYHLILNRQFVQQFCSLRSFRIQSLIMVLTIFFVVFFTFKLSFGTVLPDVSTRNFANWNHSVQNSAPKIENSTEIFIDCAPEGFSFQQECESKGCLWKPQNIPGAPWCFFPTDPKSMAGYEVQTVKNTPAAIYCRNSKILH